LATFLFHFGMNPIRHLLFRYSSNREAYYKAQLLVYFGLVEILISACYYFVHPHFGFRVPRMVFSGLGLSVIIQILLLNLPVPLIALAHGLIATLWVSFCIGIATSGGIFSLVLPWLAVMPIMANLLIHHRAAMVWAFISLLSIGVFFLLEVYPDAIDHSSLRSLAANSGLVVITFVFTWLFHRAQTNLVIKVSSKNKKLEARKNRLIRQHQEIQAQKSFIEKQNQLLHSQNRSIEKINQLLHERVQEITSRNEILGQHWQTLLAITKSYTVNFGRLDEALAHVTETVSKSLNIDRVSIWRYHPDLHKIVCIQLTDTVQPETTTVELTLEEFPEYYKALMMEQVIPAVEAQVHWQTRGLKDKYLTPRKIVSMMDCPFFIAGKLGGVLCCESREKRNWGNEDILFAQALSDIVTLSIMSQERRVYEATLIEKQAEVILVNQSLEARVKQRTEELEKQNTQLAEYAYINSHLLRAPLSRLLGLVNLVRYTEVAGAEREQIIQHIQVAGQELDEVVAKINEALGFKRTFDRSFFSDPKRGS
jgi:GAF domain-containing protein